MRLEHIVVHHGDILPPGNVAGFYLLRVAELPEDGVYFVVQSEHPEAVVVEIGDFGVNARSDELKDILGQTMALGFSFGCSQWG